MYLPPIRLAKAALGAGLIVLGTAGASGAAGADALTVHERGTDINPGSQNPCTGVMGTIVDLNDIHFHVTTRPDGTIDENGHNTADVTFVPDDPSEASYHGHETYAFHEGGAGSRSTTTTFHVRMHGTDGSWLDVRETAHVTLRADGAAVVSFDRARLECS